MKNNIELRYINPDEKQVGIVVSNYCYEVNIKSIKKFYKQISTKILKKKYKKYTRLD